MRKVFLAAALFASLLLAGDPWSANDVLQPSEVAADLKSALLIHVGFPALYHGAHIAGSKYAGPGSKPEGIAELKKVLASEPRTRRIVLYCGCCPWEKCPNIRPAYSALREMGFTDLKVMIVPENLKADWVDKGYP